MSYLTSEDMKHISDSLSNVNKKMMIFVVLFYILFIYYFIKQCQV